ncbi:MAG: hypothetical protein ABSC92_09200 [Rhizomicrobium sp.]|jgi:tetratricopeptide (TPR) repeat protein
MKAVLCGALLMLMAASAAHADAIADGNAGLTALQGGDYDNAIRLFTRALKSGGLTGDDLEFAYANRGKAYLMKADYSSAIVDLDKARQMKPDDTDAQNNLQTALEAKLPADSVPGRPKANPWEALGQAVLNGVAQGIAAGLQPPSN